jgi:hypothetical protein
MRLIWSDKNSFKGRLSVWSNNRTLCRTKGVLMRQRLTTRFGCWQAGGLGVFLCAVDGSFTLISEACVDGMMNGEGVRDVEETLGPI